MPINRSIGVNLAFTADTTKAQQQLKQLQSSLESLVAKASSQSPLGLTKEISSAVSDVNKLGIALKNATTNTGQLDLTQFKQQLDKAGLTAEKISSQLISLGPAGKKAFSELSQSIATAEVPMKRASTLMTNFLTTLKNTARWQISSSILHGFIGSIQTAYYYAKDLNESLNNIRIVTGKSTDEMAVFAKEANEAAKALSTTTTAYTDASLIYYQQGLSDEEVKARTDVTVKMANVARESAEEVSEQLTAVWNNFAEGADNLEYYADVMTALGAATASSSAEIAEGLEKFAAVADTVGLSYEYATSALATVTATTRQSADIVGNAFKTLFARMQGLKLGETLDDGTDLNKYSAALDAVGISIKKSDGELKEMDAILDELGARWQSLTKDQQMALAQTVAGVRQYTQLIALMDQWEFFQENLAVARGAEGTLQKQAEIYAESWEAAEKRVKAAAETIYSDLLNDKFFISITDGFADILNIIDKTIGALGGLKGVLSVVSTILLNAFNKELVASLDRMAYNIKASLGATKQEALELRNSFASAMKSMADDATPFGSAQVDVYQKQGQLQDQLIDKTNQLLSLNKELTQEEKNYVSSQLELTRALGENYLSEVKRLEILDQELAKQKEQVLLTMQSAGQATGIGIAGRNDQLERVIKLKEVYNTLVPLVKKYEESAAAGDKNAAESFSKIIQILQDLGRLDLGDGTKVFKNIDLDIEKIKNSIESGNLDGAFKQLNDDIKILGDTAQSKEESLKNLFNTLSKKDLTAEQRAAVEAYNQSLNNLLSTLKEQGVVVEQVGKGWNSYNNAVKLSQDIIDQVGTKAASTSEKIVAFATTLSSIAMVTNQIKGLVDTLKDENLSGAEKLLSIMTSLGFIVPTLISTFSKLTKTFITQAAVEGTLTAVEEANTIAKAANSTAEEVNTALKGKNALATATNTVAYGLNTLGVKANTAALIANKIALFGIVGIIAAVGVGLVALVDYLVLTDKEANKAINDASSELDSLTSELDTLENKLNEINSQIKDLLDKGTLSLTDKEDLARLQAESAELKAQIELNKEKQKIEAQKIIETGDEAWQKGSYGKAENFSYENIINKNSDAEDVKKYIENYSKEMKVSLDEMLSSDELFEDFRQRLLSDTMMGEEGSNELKQFASEIKDAYLLREQYFTDENREANSEYIDAVDKFGTAADKASQKYKDALTWMENYWKSTGSWTTMMQEVKNSIEGLEGDDVQRVIQAFAEKWDVSVESINEDLDLYEAKIEELPETTEDVVEQMTTSLGQLNDVMSALRAGDDLDKDQTEYLTELENKYRELGYSIDVWNRGSREYIEVLEQVMQAEEDLANNQLKESLEEKVAAFKDLNEEYGRKEVTRYNGSQLETRQKTEVEIEADTSAVSEALDDIFDTKYELEIGLTNDILSDIDAVIEKADNAAIAVEKIGQGFQVAAEDARDVLNVFPELAEGAKVLANGTIQLDDEVTTHLLSNYGIVIDADKQKTIESINNRIQQLQSEKEALEEELAAIQSKSADEINLDDLVTQYLMTDNEDIATSDKNTTDAAITNSGILAETIISNWAECAKAAKEYGRMAEEAAGGTEPDMGDFSTAGVKKTGSTVEPKATERTAQDKAALKQQVEGALQKQIESYERQIADLTAGASALLSKTGPELEKAATKGLENKDKSGSGGGKGKSAKEPKEKEEKAPKEKEIKEKEKKEFDDEFDRYWQLKKTIDAVTKALERFDKVKQNLYGRELVKALQLENEMLEQQKKNYEDLAVAQQEEAEELREQLSTMGVLFDDAGAITNYAAATANALEMYNSGIEKYNSGAIDDDSFGTYEKSFEDFKKLLERYDELYYNEIEETKDKIDDLTREQVANNLKAWEVTLQFKLDTKELERGWNDFLKEMEKDFKKVYEDLRVESKALAKDAQTYIGDDGTISETIKAINDVTKEIDVMRAGGKSTMFESISQAQEKLKELNEELQTQATDLKSLYEEAWEAYLEGIDQTADKFDNLMDQYEKIDDELSFQQEIIELLYGEEAYKLMSKLYEGQEKNTEAQIKSLKQQADMWEKLWRDSGATMENQSSWTEDQKKYYEQWQEAQSGLNDKVIEYIKLLKEDYLNTVKDVLKTLETNITGSSLENIQEEWDRISEQSEKYFDDVEKLYQIQSLANKINSSIADTSSLKAQQKLAALRDKEIEYLREKDKLTQYDLDTAEARYQIALKEIALEEAQNNKTSMKLTRNEQGNWSYQYIADEEDVISKRQDLLDAFNQLYQLASDAYEANLQTAQDLWQAYLEKVQEIRENDELKEEEKQEKIKILTENFYSDLETLAYENSLYRDDLTKASAALILAAYEADKTAYDKMTDDEKELAKSLKDANIETFAEMEGKIDDNYKNIGDMSKNTMKNIRDDWDIKAQELASFWNSDNGASIKKQVNNAIAEMEKASESYQLKVNNVAIAVERDFSEEGISGAIKKAEDETDKLKDKTQILVEDSHGYLSDLRGYVEETGLAWQYVQSEIITTIGLIQEYLQYLGEVLSTLSAITAVSYDVGDTSGLGGTDSYADDSDSGSKSGSGSDSGNGNGSGNNSKNSGGGSTNNYTVYSDPNGAANTWKVTNEGTGNSRIVGGVSNSAQAVEKVKKEGLATGGYTGEWKNGSTDGRLAWLHQKELVLNENDTVNFLSGVNMIRDMVASTGSIEKAIAQSVANMIYGLGHMNFNGGNVISGGSSSVSNTDNVFNITAEFPNANDVNEIREAILSLPNIASQYIANNNK